MTALFCFIFPDGYAGVVVVVVVEVVCVEIKYVFFLDPRFMLSLLKIEGKSIVEQVSTTQMYFVQQINYMIKGEG